MAARDWIETQGAALAAAINGGDAAAAAALYTEDAVLMPAAAPRRDGREAIRGFWQSAVDGGLTDVVLRTGAVEELGPDAAVEEGVLEAALGGTPLAGKYLVHWRRADGAWKLHRDIWNWDS